MIMSVLQLAQPNFSSSQNLRHYNQKCKEIMVNESKKALYIIQSYGLL